MRKWLIACALLTGCVPDLAPFLLEEIAEDPRYDEPIIEEPQPLVLSDGTVVPITSTAWMEPGERIAFVASNEGVVCRRLTVGGWDEVMLVEPGNEPTGIDITGDGSLLVSDEDGIKKMNSSWTGVVEIMDPIEGTTLGKIDCTASGDIVVAAKTDEGSKIIVVDQNTGDILTESMIHKDTVIVVIDTPSASSVRGSALTEESSALGWGKKACVPSQSMTGISSSR